MFVTPVSQKVNSIICSYVNATNIIQVGRIANIKHWYFERVIFPGQRIIFEAYVDGILEIHSSQCANAVLADRILCQKIAINQS